MLLNNFLQLKVILSLGLWQCKGEEELYLGFARDHEKIEKFESSKKIQSLLRGNPNYIYSEKIVKCKLSMCGLVCQFGIPKFFV